MNIYKKRKYFIMAFSESFYTLWWYVLSHKPVHKSQLSTFQRRCFPVCQFVCCNVCENSAHGILYTLCSVTKPADDPSSATAG